MITTIVMNVLLWVIFCAWLSVQVVLSALRRFVYGA